MALTSSADPVTAAVWARADIPGKIAGKTNSRLTIQLSFFIAVLKKVKLARGWWSSITVAVAELSSRVCVKHVGFAGVSEHSSVDPLAPGAPVRRVPQVRDSITVAYLGSSLPKARSEAKKFASVFASALAVACSFAHSGAQRRNLPLPCPALPLPLPVLLLVIQERSGGIRFCLCLCLPLPAFGCLCLAPIGLPSHQMV